MPNIIKIELGESDIKNTIALIKASTVKGSEAEYVGALIKVFENSLIPNLETTEKAVSIKTDKK